MPGRDPEKDPLVYGMGPDGPEKEIARREQMADAMMRSVLNQGNALDRYRALAGQQASQADLDQLHGRALQALQASPLAGVMYPSGVLGQALQATPPPGRPPMGASDRDLQWVWKHLPAGSTIYVSVGSGTAILAPEGAPVGDVQVALVPCLRAANLGLHVPTEQNQREAEAAVMLLSIMAFGDKEALKVVVLQRVQGP